MNSLLGVKWLWSHFDLRINWQLSCLSSWQWLTQNIAAWWSSFIITENVMNLPSLLSSRHVKSSGPLTRRRLWDSPTTWGNTSKGELLEATLCNCVQYLRHKEPESEHSRQSDDSCRKKVCAKGRKPTVSKDIFSKLTILSFVWRKKHRHTSKTQAADMSVVGANQRVSDCGDWLAHAGSTHSWCVQGSS